MPVRAGVHPVLEALRARAPLDRVLVASGASSARLQEIIDLCRELSIPLRFEPREALDRVAGSSVHQGVVALGAAREPAELESLLPGAQLLVLLDGVEDPHNLGAIIRSAHAAGADAVVIPDRRAAGLTPAVAKAAAGALEHLPVARVGNISRTLERLKALGFWIYGLDQRGAEDYDRISYTLPTALVLGGEGHGLHANVGRHCDFLVRIPLAGKISSLNVSVAAGIVLFEWKRRRR
ncbi:MAG: 23S rRNA (guanosine(2251)-2'-O)-methyltransferase RlmB [Bryobacteraceae bacterium]|jgi:23S rRNA (guanosine2251-2'-O)-methyltransferase